MSPKPVGASLSRKPSSLSCAQCHKLAALDATVGRPRPELRPDIRSFPYKGYVIFFRYRARRFEVVNILEGHRDIESFFGDKGKR
jgi:toxin ParE1/3/4